MYVQIAPQGIKRNDVAFLIAADRTTTIAADVIDVNDGSAEAQDVKDWVNEIVGVNGDPTTVIYEHTTVTPRVASAYAAFTATKAAKAAQHAADAHHHARGG